MIFPNGDYARALQEAAEANRAEYARLREEAPERQEMPLDLSKCALCGRVGQEMREYGSPISYWSCCNVLDCEKIRKRKNGE